MVGKLWLPSAADVQQIHDELVVMFAAEKDPIVPPETKDRGLLESSCNRPHTGLGVVDKYRTLEQKTAALFHSLVTNHVFWNGNKRTAVVALLTVLAKNDRCLKNEVTDDLLFDVTTSLADNRFPRPAHGEDVDSIVSHLAEWLRQHNAARTAQPKTMRLREFIESCEAAGAHVKESGPSYVIAHGSRSIRVGRDSAELSGPVVRSYLKKLALSEALSGVPIDEFQAGLPPEQREIRRYRNLLKRLAHS